MTVSVQIFCQRTIFISIFTIVCLSVQSNAMANEVTFSEAWQLVRQNNDELAASKLNKEEAVYLRDAARALFFPKIDINGSYTRLNEEVKLAPSALLDAMPQGDSLLSVLGLTPSAADEAFTTQVSKQNVITASLNIVWPVYTGGRISAVQDVAAGQLMEAKHLLRIKRQALFEKLTKYYFGVVLAKQILITRTDAERGLFKHLEHAKKLEKEGQIPRVERLKAEASHTKAFVEQRKAQQNLEISEIALTQLLKEKVNVSPVNTLFINDELPLLDDITYATLENHPGLGVLKSKRTQAQGVVDIAKGAYFPQAFVFGNYSLYKQDVLANELVPDWFVGLGLTLPLVSRHGRSEKLRAAKSMLNKLDHLKRQAINDLELLVEKTWREAQIAREEYTGLASSLKLANENIHMRELAFAQGLSTSLEVVDAELFLVSVKTQRQVAAYQYVLSLARLLALSNQMTQFPEYQASGNY